MLMFIRSAPKGRGLYDLHSTTAREYQNFLYGIHTLERTFKRCQLFLFAEKYRPDPFPIHTVLADFYVRWRHWQSFKTRKTVQRPEIQGAQSEQLLLSNTSHRWKFSTVVRQGASWEPFQGLGCRLRLRLWQTLAPKKRENISVHFVLWHSFGTALAQRHGAGGSTLAPRPWWPASFDHVTAPSSSKLPVRCTVLCSRVWDAWRSRTQRTQRTTQTHAWNKDETKMLELRSQLFRPHSTSDCWSGWSEDNEHEFIPLAARSSSDCGLPALQLRPFSNNFKQFRPFCVRFDSVWCFLSVALCPEEVLVGHLGGPGLVLMDPPYEPYNEYLTWNLYTIHMLLGSTWIWIYLALLALLAPALNLWDHASRVQIKSLQLSAELSQW